MIKRIVFNITLTLALILLTVVIIKPLLAEIQFNAAQYLASAGDWEGTEVKFTHAIGKDPFNSTYPAALGKFLLSKIDNQKSGSLRLENSELSYRYALRLNPRNAEYELGLGQAQLNLYLLDHKKYAEKLRSGLESFKRAAQKDKNSFNISYSVGYGCLPFWRYLSEDEKRLVLDRLGYILKTKPLYCIYVYPKIWQYTKNFTLMEKITPMNLESQGRLYDFMVRNNLWQFRKSVVRSLDTARQNEDSSDFEKEKREKLERIENIKKMFESSAKSEAITEFIPKEDWRGNASDGKTEIVDGVMYWNGTIYTPLKMEAGKAVISIAAKKLLVVKTENPHQSKFYPYMVVRLDDEEIGETFVSGDDWKEYRFAVTTSGGVRILNIDFVNDIYDIKKTEDRNLCVGDVYITYE